MKLKKIDKNRLCLAFDGFSASGKSLGAKLISRKYKLKLLNSGLLYRYAAFLILNNKPKKKIPFLKKKFTKLNYKYLTSLNLHSQEISNYSAIIAKQKKVRLVLKEYQKKFAKKFNRIAIEGRDISTKILNKKSIDEVIQIANETAFSTAKMAAKVEGLPIGISSGAALAAGIEVAQRNEMKNKKIIVIIPSFAERYLSTPLFN